MLEASSCSQAMRVIAEHPNLGLILLDLNLPDRDGFSVPTELGKRYLAIFVVVLSAQPICSALRFAALMIGVQRMSSAFTRDWLRRPPGSEQGMRGKLKWTPSAGPLPWVC